MTATSNWLISEHIIPISLPGGHQIQWAGFFFCSLAAKLPSRLHYKSPRELAWDHQKVQNLLEGDQRILGSRTEVSPPLQMQDWGFLGWNRKYLSILSVCGILAVYHTARLRFMVICLVFFSQRRQYILLAQAEYFISSFYPISTC